MITISISEAEFFDRWSILMLKQRGGLGVQDEMRLLWLEGIDGMGMDKLRNILSSDVFKNLYDVNKKLFEIIDKTRTEKIDANIVTQLNDNRFTFKKQIQSEFFGDELKERKNFENKPATRS